MTNDPDPDRTKHADNTLTGADDTNSPTQLPRGTGPAAPSVPTGYELFEELGRGGMGVVYRARDLSLGRFAAIKTILNGHYTDDLTRTRFLIEAETVAMIKHPSVVQVYGFGYHEGLPYVVFEYVDGGNLATRLSNGLRPPPEDAARLVVQLADGTAAAHAKGIVHRDLKPSNILFATDGVPKITDFGIAKRADRNVTTTGAVIGTPAYMSPEQAAGDTDQVGTPADVYSLGVILYELLTGRPPFQGSSHLETMNRVIHEQPTSVRTLAPNVPRDLETITLHCLHKEPGRRYATAAALADDLRAFLDRRPLAVRPSTGVERLIRRCQRQPAVAALSVLLGLSVVVVPPLLWSYDRRMAAEAGRREQEEKARQSAEQVAATQSYFANVNRALRRIATPKPGWTADARTELLTAAAADTALKDVVELRSALMSVEAAVDVLPPIPMADISPGVGGNLGVSPDGRWVVCADRRCGPTRHGSRIRFFDGRTRELVHDLTYPHDLVRGLADINRPDGTRSLLFSPDGRWLVLGTRHGEIVRWQLDRLPTGRTVWSGPDAEVAALAIDDRSESVFALLRDRTVCRRRLTGDGTDCQTRPTGLTSPPLGMAYVDQLPGGAATGGLLVFDGTRHVVVDPGTLQPLVDPYPAVPVAFPKVHPASRALFVQSSGGIHRYDTRSGLLTGEFANARSDPAGRLFAVSPDGTLLAAVTEADRLVVTSVTDGRVVTNVSLGKTHDLAFAADGRSLYAATDTGILVFPIRPSEVRTVCGLQSTDVLAMVADDRGLATVSGVRHGGSTRAYVWPPAERSVPPGLPLDPLAPTFFTDAPQAERPVLCVATARTLHALDRPTHALTTLATLSAPLRALAYDPNGRWLWTAEENSVSIRSAADGTFQKRWQNLLNLSSGRGQMSALGVGSSGAVAACRDGVTVYLASGTGKVLGQWLITPDTPETVALLPDESLVLVGSVQGRVRGYRLPGGEEALTQSAHDGAVTAIATHAVGRSDVLVATGSNSGQVTLWAWTAGRLERLTDLQPLGTEAVRQLAFGYVNTGLVLYVLNAKSSAVWAWDLNHVQATCQQAGLGWSFRFATSAGR